jgi:hypothetical protein
MKGMGMKKLLATLLFIPIVASAEFTSGNDLYKDLRSDKVSDNIYALGYIAGVADAGQSGSHCIPSTVSLGQLQDMAIDYLRRNADVRNLSADVLIGLMLLERWPCKNKSKGGKGV